jgi:hypothetical protein
MKTERTTKSETRALTIMKGKIVVRVSYNPNDELPIWVSHNVTPAYTTTIRMTMQDARDLLSLLGTLQ